MYACVTHVCVHVHVSKLTCVIVQYARMQGSAHPICSGMRSFSFFFWLFSHWTEPSSSLISKKLTFTPKRILTLTKVSMVIAGETQNIFTHSLSLSLSRLSVATPPISPRPTPNSSFISLSGSDSLDPFNHPLMHSLTLSFSNLIFFQPFFVWTYQSTAGINEYLSLQWKIEGN